MQRLQPSILALTLLTCAPACGGSEAETASQPLATAPSSAPAAATPAPELAEPPASPGTPTTTPTTAPPTTPTTPEVAPVPATPNAPGALRVVALREGPVELFRQQDAPLLALEGEPVPWVGGAFTRDPRGSGELSPDDVFSEAYTTLAVANFGDPLGVWTSTEQDFMRSASVYGVFQRVGDHWQAQDLRKGLLVAYYAAFVERDGTLLALQQWAPDPAQAIDDYEGDDPKVDAQRAKLDRALTRAKPSWVALAGPKPASTPTIPAKLRPTGGVGTTADGTILALGMELVAEDRLETALLMWPPGESTAERLDVPELRNVNDPTVVSSGEWSFVTGSLDGEGGVTESYLAMGQGREWQRIPVTLPGRSDKDSRHVSGALRTPEGELWIAMGSRWDGDEQGQSVWRKPLEGAWQPVAIPSLSSEMFGPPKAWVRDPSSEEGGWTEVERHAGPVAIGRASGVVWADGAVWISVYAGYAYDGMAEMQLRTAVLTTKPGTAPITVLPPAWELVLERRNHARRSAEPGAAHCSDFSLVLGPATLASNPELLAALTQLAPPGGDRGTIDSIYVGTLDGAEVLVASAHIDSAKYASSLRKGASLALRAAGVEGGTATADCRIPLVSRMVSRPGEP